MLFADDSEPVAPQVTTAPSDAKPAGNDGMLRDILAELEELRSLLP